MNPLTVGVVPIGDLRPHPDNPRNGDVDAIAESLTVNGQYKPIVVARDGTVLAGNHTYMAALTLGWPALHAVVLPVAWDSREAVRILVTDNRTSDLGRYDEAQLLTVMDTFDDLTGTGWTTEALAALERDQATRDKTPLSAACPCCGRE